MILNQGGRREFSEAERQADPSEAAFEDGLRKYFGGRRDTATMEVLARWRGGED